MGPMQRKAMMSAIGNIIWMIFGGFLAGLGYIVGGLAMCLTIIGVPWGVKAMKLGVATMLPFGKSTVPTTNGVGAGAMIANIIWLMLFGWEIALSHLVSGVILAITIVGIPFAKQHFKLAPVALLPFSYDLTDDHIGA